ncbi:ACR289Wp [Eremothecium gossypii ATCC 10895]|uniref:ACR289Wp n=1 Tax=Eremothecium gossypii (strain ATCC 10895 / CBS 109.51 / FGSC 9923 / NRRL Y-1056) TaxID=284811 RepID=Q75BI2_EREGS|nr:ACR289Wp [Eremothecium gossypii ATCC 10895]AAS51515.1 ACR289Wp [Eremothecium gossypii ATCC 10895]AEY95807.1 FACR289Wp [Eremothecium gossypii FDAG1]
MDDRRQLIDNTGTLESSGDGTTVSGFNASGKKEENQALTTCLAIGIALLWPWNCLLSASLFFQQTLFTDSTVYAAIYTSTMMTTSTGASLVYNFYLSQRQSGYVNRVSRGLECQAGVFGALCVLVLAHRAIPMPLTFVLLMALVLLSSLATTMTQNGIMAITNIYGPSYSRAVMVGQAIAGVLPSVVMFVLSLATQQERQSSGSAIVYFLSTVGISVTALLLYRSSSLHAGLVTPAQAIHVPFRLLYSRLQAVVLSIFITFLFSLSFPVFANATLAAVLLPNSQFIPLAFTIWNAGDLFGRLVADRPWVQAASIPHRLLAASALRGFMIPVFFLFNINGTHPHSGLLLDLLYLFWHLFFGLTNGLFITLAFMSVSALLDSDDQRKAASGFTNLFLALGLTCGSIFSYLVVFLLPSVH